MEAVEELVNEHINLARYITYQIHEKITPKGFYDYDDLFQEGSIGLMKAAQTYDPQKGIKFSTYSGTCIKNQIFMYIRKMNKYLGMVYLDEYLNQDNEKYGTHSDNLRSTLPTPEDVLLTNELKRVMERYPLKLGRPSYYSDRETKIYELMCKGYYQHEIKGIVGCSQRMASSHQNRIRNQVRKIWLENY